ncbi:MAG: hypothetical protein NVSMB25_26230 [Thermoleophilaceae bacterium]
MSGPAGTEATGRARAAAPGALRFVVEGSLDAPFEARHVLADRLGHRVDEAAFDDALVLLSELVTNCVRHGGARDGRPIRVSAVIESDLLHVEVSSSGPAFEHLPRGPHPDDPAGRGLNLVDALAERWGIEAELPTTVWFEVRLARKG